MRQVVALVGLAVMGWGCRPGTEPIRPQVFSFKYQLVVTPAGQDRSDLIDEVEDGTRDLQSLLSPTADVCVFVADFQPYPFTNPQTGTPSLDLFGTPDQAGANLRINVNLPVNAATTRVREFADEDGRRVTESLTPIVPNACDGSATMIIRSGQLQLGPPLDVGRTTNTGRLDLSVDAVSYSSNGFGYFEGRPGGYDPAGRYISGSFSAIVTTTDPSSDTMIVVTEGAFAMD
jgi:hypothetical protein